MPEVPGPRPEPRAGNISQVRIDTSSPEQTEALGRRLGQLLQAGDIVALSGDLGAGKTVLARGIAEGAGAAGYIASPTFTFIRAYRCAVTVYRVDLYRRDRPEQLEALRREQLLDGTALVARE